MENKTFQIVHAPMKIRTSTERQTIAQHALNTSNRKKQLRYISLSVAAFLCLGVGIYQLKNNPEDAVRVMKQVTADFEYDETLGRLQFVSNILPESAMVFMENSIERDMTRPHYADETHEWKPDEPWIEYRGEGKVFACDAGYVMDVVKNRKDEYTVRLSHDMGYESVYSGLSQVYLTEDECVVSGEEIGRVDDGLAFEIRRDGMSICPAFSELNTEGK